MSDTNCLQGIRCPECGQEDRFEIEIKVMVEVTDEGTGDFTSNVGDWEDSSYIACKECRHPGTVAEFTITEEGQQ